MAVGPLAPIDRATLLYVGVALGFTLTQGPRAFPASVLLPSSLVAAGLLAATVAPRARRTGPVGQLLAEIYPLLLTAGFYTEIGLVNLEAGVSHDHLVQRWERVIFRGEPSLEWIRAFPSPAWSTLMHGAYLSYYLILAGAPLGLWYAGRRASARGAAFATMVTFYTCYTVFLVFPVAGPRYCFPMADNAATAVPLAAFTHRFLERGSAWGTAFPSSHVAAALVAAVCAWRGWRPLGAVLVPAALLLTLATVYGQFHYAIDAAVGAALAAAVLLVLRRAGQGQARMPPTGCRQEAPELVEVP